MIDEEQGEHTTLLPSNEDGPSTSTYDSTTIDHQKAKERLHVIVKAKEGKMVRVLARGPFNLRNDPENGLPNASSSRSYRSPSTNVSQANTSGLDPYGGDNDSRQSSSKYVPSPSVSRSESASSVQQASISRVSTDEFSEQNLEHRLKVQLVSTAKGNQRIYSRRGRSKTKHGRFEDDAEGASNMPTLEGIQSVDSGRGDFYTSEHLLHPKSDEENAVASGSNNAKRPQVAPLSNEENAEIKAISKQLSPWLKDEFEDVGTLTRSWGD